MSCSLLTTDVYNLACICTHFATEILQILIVGALLDTYGVMVDRIIASKDVYILISESCKCYRSKQTMQV